MCVVIDSYAEDDAMAILNKKRAEIEKAEKAKAKLAKEAEEKAEKEAKEQAKLAEEKAKAQVAESVETVEAPAEAVVATEGLNPQDEKRSNGNLRWNEKENKGRRCRNY